MRPQPTIAPPSADEVSKLVADDSGRDETAKTEARQKRAEWLKTRGLVEQVRKYKLITPLFGGGVVAGVNDDVTPISGKAIRGHMRFWWRATRAGRFNADLEAMLEFESRLFGAAATEGEPRDSKVQVSISEVTEIASAAVRRNQPYYQRHRVSDGWQQMTYAAFPFQDNPQYVTYDISFKVTISFPETIKDKAGVDIFISPEINAALWAWETFGGVGARTRRGFGALLCTSSAGYKAKVESIESRIQQELNTHVADGVCHPDVPHVSKDLSFIVVGREGGRGQTAQRNPYSSAEEAWEELIRRLKEFRQARTGAGGRGRSKWPEPEKIRRITGHRLKDHLENGVLHSHAEDIALKDIESFPRGQFGLPIIFQFKRDQKNQVAPNNPNLDPVDTTLKGGPIGSTGKFRERLASPLILRPLACGNNEAVGLAIILRAPRRPPEGLCLVGNGVEESVSADLVRQDALKIEPVKSFAALKADGDEIDVLEAFLDEKLRFKEKKK